MLGGRPYRARTRSAFSRGTKPGAVRPAYFFFVFLYLKVNDMNINCMAQAFRALSLAGLTLAFAPAIAAPTWDAAADFSGSASSGIAGAWSYGSFGSSIHGPFLAFDAFTDYSGYAAWSYGDRSVQIGRAGAANFASGSVIVPARALNASPGPGGQYAVLRFTAPAAGSYAIDAGFWGNDFAGPTTTDVHVLARGASVFDGAVQSYGRSNGLAWSDTLALSVGDTVDFAVGFGANRTWNYDNTGLSASVSSAAAVPEPGSISMIFAGLFLVGLMSRRKFS